jgi:hypothetical protein
MDDMNHRDIERLLRGRIPVGEEDPELARFLQDFEQAYPEPAIDHCESAHLSAVFAAAQQLAAADRPVHVKRGTKEATMKKRHMGLLAWVAVVALAVLALGATVAFAGPGVFTGGSDTTVTERTTTTLEAVVPPVTDTTLPSTDTTLPSTDTTVPSTDTTVGESTTDTTQPGDTTTTAGATTSSTTHPANFGGTISRLRKAGDHTPAAVIKGKKVPGYYKKHTTTTTTQATMPTT